MYPYHIGREVHYTLLIKLFIVITEDILLFVLPSLPKVLRTQGGFSIWTFGWLQVVASVPQGSWIFNSPNGKVREWYLRKLHKIIQICIVLYTVRTVLQYIARTHTTCHSFADGILGTVMRRTCQSTVGSTHHMATWVPTYGTMARCSPAPLTHMTSSWMGQC